MTYEFNLQDSLTISRVADKFLIGSILMGLGGLFAIISAFQQRSSTDLANFLLWLLEAATQLASAYFLMLPRKNLKRVATTEGKDIEELMKGIDTSTKSFNFIVIFIIVATVSTILHLVI